MMIRDMSRRTLLFLTVVALLVIWSAFSLDYSGLSTFSLSMGMDVFKGLAQPDWAFLYDGSGEDLVSLLLLTIGISRISFCDYFCESCRSRSICWSDGDWCSSNRYVREAVYRGNGSDG